MLRVIMRMLADTILVAVLLFVGAGSLHWWRAWVLVVALLGVRILTSAAAYRVNPQLMLERTRLPIHRGQPWTDRVLVLGISGLGFLGLPVLAAMDVWRWHLLPSPPAAITAVGLGLFVAGWTTKGAVLRVNAFATSVVRFQREREHRLVDSGPYSVVRHPFYVGTPLVLCGMTLWLQSWTATLLALVPVAFVLFRIVLEERFLRRELAGYEEYTRRVRYRLVPGVW